MTPYASISGDSLRFVDALFTATSAVCVTGLVVVDTGTYFSVFGQSVILLLIQIGGLGVMTVADVLKTVRSRDGKTVSEDEVIAAMTPDVAMVLLPSVLYRSAQLLAMKRLTAAAPDKGIVIGFDLCLSIGTVDHNFADIDCDFAVW